MNRIDQQRLIRLRLSRGLAVRQLARDCGIEISVLNRLETSDDPTLSTLSIAALIRVANHLGVPVGDLFSSDDETAAPTEAVDDVRMLGALLTAMGGDTAVIAIADGLGWDVPRIHSTATDLDQHIRQVGMTVYKYGGLIGLRPVADDHSDAEVRVRRHPRAKPAQRLVTPARARILYRAAHQPISPHSLSASDRTNVAVLLKAGALVENDDRFYVPSSDVTDSLAPVKQPGVLSTAFPERVPEVIRR